MRYEDEFFHNSQTSELWQRYCGFLHLSLTDFTHIQRDLLLEQIKTVASGPLAQRFFPGGRVQSVAEFRAKVPLSNYDDYADLLADGQSQWLNNLPEYWIHTSAHRGSYKKVPWAERFHNVQSRNIIAAFILSAAQREGDIRLKPGSRVLNLLPPMPFASASVAYDLVKQFSVRALPALDDGEAMSFSQKINTAINMGLEENVDYVIAMTSSLVRSGQLFHRAWRKYSSNRAKLLGLHHGVGLRLLKPRRQPISLPGDAWAIKGIICWGADSDSFAGTIAAHWGRQPLQMYASSEGGVMAMQDWHKGAMVFLPDSVFLEFIPEKYVHADNPPTVLLNEVKNGEKYEVVLTNFYGMPFLRYRQGDLVQMVLAGKSKGEVPRIIFAGRADDTLDLFGICRLNTQVMAEALHRAALPADLWYISKAVSDGKIVLNLYLENTNGAAPREIERDLSRALKSVDRHWAEAVFTMGYNPVRVKQVPAGTLRRLVAGRDGSTEVQINAAPSSGQQLESLSEART